MTVGDVAALLQLPNNDARVNLNCRGKIQNCRTREVRLDASYEALKSVLRNEPLYSPLVGAFLVFQYTSLCIVTDELLVQTSLAFDDVRELVEEGEPEPIHAVVAKGQSNYGSLFSQPEGTPSIRVPARCSTKTRRTGRRGTGTAGRPRQPHGGFSRRETQQSDACVHDGPGCVAGEERGRQRGQAQLQRACADGEPQRTGSRRRGMAGQWYGGAGCGTGHDRTGARRPGYYRGSRQGIRHPGFRGGDTEHARHAARGAKQQGASECH
jgi:hypothetical protein